MPRPLRRSLAPLFAVAILAGCTSAEDRINAAVPVAPRVEIAHVAISALGTQYPEAVAAVDDEYRSRLKLRALNCANGVAPSLLGDDDAIRAQIANAPCFAEKDAELARWLTLRRIALYAGLPALRPVPQTPSEVLGAEPGLARFAVADAAGVAALQWRSHVRLVDLASGAAIHDEDVGLRGGLALSPNGRLFAVGGEELAQVHASDSGELLLALPNVLHGQLHWVGSQALAYQRPDGSQLELLDLASGKATTLSFADPALTGVHAVAGRPGLFLLVAPRRIVQLQLDATGTATLLGEARRSEAAWAGAEIAPGPDGTLFFGDGGNLVAIDPRTLARTEVALAPLRVLQVLPTRDRDRLVVTTVAGSKVATSLYSRAGNTLAPMAQSPRGGFGERVRFVPSLGRIAVMEMDRVVLRGDFEAGAPRPVGDVLEAAAFDVALAQVESADQRARFQASRADDRARVPAVESAAPPPRSPRETAAARPEDKYRVAKDALADAVDRGVLRVAGPDDIAAWKREYERKAARRIPERFEFWAGSGTVYVITRAFVVPDNLTGPASATFILERNAPYPRGTNQHSAILDMKSGGCTGSMCRFLLSDD